MTKAEAATQQEKSDSAPDYCELFDWYGDGICDSFCVLPDPDCEEEPQICPDPEGAEVQYLGETASDCAAIVFQCEPWQTSFSNDCGCGCLGPIDEPSCPDPSDPEVHYISETVDECLNIFFGCEPWQTLFSDACGCGCIGPE